MYYIHVSEPAPGVPYNVSIAAENGGAAWSRRVQCILVYFTQELGI
jgi:hypothetical protein